MSQQVVFKSSGGKAALIELYSSEGCSSCPPAEEWLNRWKDSPGLWKDVFPVNFHVDYWDGLGWPDRFARPEYTARQQTYAAGLGQDSVYTPEFVANGMEWKRGWFDGTGLPTAGAEKTGQLTLTVSGKETRFSAEYVAGAGGDAPTLNVAVLGFNVVSEVKRGENSGRSLKHDFVVLGFGSTPMTKKTETGFRSEPVEVKSATDDVPGAVVAWVSGKDGTILQVTGGWLVAAGD